MCLRFSSDGSEGLHRGVDLLRGAADGVLVSNRFQPELPSFNLAQGIFRTRTATAHMPVFDLSEWDDSSFEKVCRLVAGENLPDAFFDQLTLA